MINLADADSFGFDISEFDKNGIHKNGTIYNDYGYDINGYDKDALLDACIAFAPEFFKSCESLNKVMSHLPDTDILEVDRPECWETLREEAREIFEKKIRMMEYPIPGKLLDSNEKYNGS